jgi:hypothetical protein
MMSFAETQIVTADDISQAATVEGEILIKYKNEEINLRTASGIEESHDLIQEQSVTKKEDIDISNISIVSVSPEEMTVEQKIIELEKDPRVEFAQPNYQYYPTGWAPNDTYMGLLWGLDDAEDNDIDALDAWLL